MRKIKIGIVGYGNLGKAVEKLSLLDDSVELVAIFSHRDIVSDFGIKSEYIYNINNYINKINILVMCGGSYQDIPKETINILKNFNVINSFDTHKRIFTEIRKANKVAKQNKKIALYSFGWDPGLFSFMRALMFGVSQTQPHTTWGKGVSMGHSNAIKAIDGVKFARAYTVPIKRSITNMKMNKSDTLELKRECYVVKKPQSDCKKIATEIANNKTYFGDCKLKIKFISEKNFKARHNKLFHEGEVFDNFELFGEKFEMSFKVKMTSNALFTAKILLLYAKGLNKIKKFYGSGAYTILEIPISKVLNLTKKEIIKNYC